MQADKNMPNHIPTGTTCLQCCGPAGMDDAGACHGNGFLCKKCGCWRRDKKTSKVHKKKRT